MGDPEMTPTALRTVPEDNTLGAAVQKLIMSASGWRKVFAASGNEDGQEEEIRVEDTWLMAAAAASFLKFLESETGRPASASTIALGMDTRPTGPALADPVIRVFVSAGAAVRHLFIASAPEIMAYAGRTPQVDAFAYFTASHNPAGHNGIKFGLSTGGVLSGPQAVALKSIFTGVAADIALVRSIVADAAAVSPDALSAVLHEVERRKQDALQTYLSFAREVLTGSENPREQIDLITGLRDAVSGAQFGVVAELNGSARTCSIDRLFLAELGLKVHAENSLPRQIAHRIVPEGESLDPCRRILTEQHRRNPGFQLGYVPDNDGDRGNLVIMSEDGESAHALHAQDVFALCCVAELSWLAYTGVLSRHTSAGSRKKVAIAVNGPTSLRVEEIAALFGAHVFRAEVGEANVVNLAALLREKGYVVRILGEGSNGGNITHPSRVRDPISTVGSLVKLLFAPAASSAVGQTPLQIWYDVKNISGKDYKDSKSGPHIAEIVATLPPYTTTSAYEQRAILKIKSSSHATLKSSYEKLFAQRFQADRKWFQKRFSISDYEEINYEGTEERYGSGPGFRTGDERGGLKMLFTDSEGAARGFVWMRGSGTEPVFRIMADIKGKDSEGEALLLSWHTRLVREADAQTSR